MPEPILVTGAAGGRQGATGRHVVNLLRRRGRKVRAFAHHQDERAERLREAGAEVVVGDLTEIADVIPAMSGVRRAYFTYPVTYGLLEATGAFAAAARQQSVELVVEVSQLAADPAAGTPRMRQHWVSEEVFGWAGVGAVHLRAAVFFENLDVVLSAGGGRELALPLGPPDTLIPIVAGTDVAQVAAGLLLADTPPDEPIVRLTGDILSIGEIAEIFGEARGHKVAYVDLPPQEWRRRAEDIYQDAHAVEHLDKLWELFQAIGTYRHELYQVTETIERIGGYPPRTLRDYAADTASR